MPDISPSTTPTTTEFAVSGMDCANCARHVTDAAQSVPGVDSASVSLKENRATVRWSSADKKIPAVIAAIKQAGYEAQELSPAASAQPARANWQLNLWLGGIVTAILSLGEWTFQWGMEHWFQWLSFWLAGVVQIVCGWQFYRGAVRQIIHNRLNMDALVALGSTTAFAFSAWMLLNKLGGHLYFTEAATIITLISLGHWLEARMSEHASGALKQLLNLAPQIARRKNPDGGETEISVAELKTGDLVILRPGDHVPVDGDVVEGSSAVDEAMLTGESKPADKSPGEKVFAGTVNLSGRLVMRVTATGAATALAHIIAAVQRAQTSRANIQRLGDRVSNVFVPAVIFIAIGAEFWWAFWPMKALHLHVWLEQFIWPAWLPATHESAAFVFATSVLIIACPCAMGLATPAAIMAAANAAARRGILIRDGVALEKAGAITAVIFDKTGTLTVGKPVVAAVQKMKDGRWKMEVLAAALARQSAHPISLAIAKISTETVELSNWKELRGCGVEANLQPLAFNLQPSTVRLGSLRWLRESGVDLSAGKSFADEHSAQGASIVGLAADGALLGLFAVKDTLKPGSRGVVETLQRQRFKVYLLTGDNAPTAASIAAQAGISAENIFAEVRPEEKAEFVKKLQARGERVAFVGDGINDAPALTQADLGIAVSRASDVAREAADIILLKSEIEAVPEALGLARATLRTIKQNLFWAFFYNAAGVPLAAMGFISPIFCAAAMGFSDFVVIGNSLRLARWKLKR